MRLFILGATGRTGAELVEQGLARGHAVTAFVRSPRKIALEHERLTVIEGDPLDAGQLRAALPGHDIVLFALGSSGACSSGMLCVTRARWSALWERVVWNGRSCVPRS